MTATTHPRLEGLYRRGRVWVVDKWVRKVRVCFSTGAADEDEAYRIALERISLVHAARSGGPRPRHRLGELIAHYLEQERRSAATVPEPRQGRLLRRLRLEEGQLRALGAALGDPGLDELGADSLAPYIAARLSQGRRVHTINAALRLLRRLLGRAQTRYVDAKTQLPWLALAPRIELLPTRHAYARPPYPLTWQEQALLLARLPAHLRAPAQFKVHTGLREAEVCALRWDWESRRDGLAASVFVIPGAYTKNGLERLVVLNRTARAVLETQRGAAAAGEDYVFTYQGRPLRRLHTAAWDRARTRAAADYQAHHGRPAPWGYAHVRVHDLKHTLGARLRAAGVPFWTRQALLGHKAATLTDHYSAAGLAELLSAAETAAETVAEAPPCPTPPTGALG